MAVIFGGSTINRPGSYSQVDTASMVPKTLGSFRVLAVVGQMADPTATIKPKTPVYFNSPADAAKAVVGGTALDCMNVAWQHGADLIAVVRADNAVAASVNLVDATIPTPVAVITLTALDFGTNGNAITAQIASGTLTLNRPANGNTAAVTETYTLTAQTNDQIVAAINKGVLVTAVKLAAAAPVGPATLTNFTAGDAGATPTVQDWTDAFASLETEFVDGVIPVTTSGAIQTIADTHCNSMSSVTNRKERRGFYGHDNGLSVTAVAALTTALSERAVLASPAVYAYDSTGAKVLRDSVLLAAAYAGIWAKQDPQVPITYKYVQFPGLEKNYKGTEISTLLTSFVAPTEYVRGKGYRIVKGITTSPSPDLTKQELSVSTLKDVMSRNVRDYMEDKYVGQAGVAGIETTIYNDLVSLIEGFKKLGWISDYVKSSVTVTKNATAFTLDWQGSPTLPINNFLITSHFTL